MQELNTDYHYKYLKYKYKYDELLNILNGGSNKNNNKNNKCTYIKFPEWIQKMSLTSNKSVNYSNFKIVPESVYSSELPFHINNWVNILQKNVKNININNKITCLNMTANVGSFDINIVNNFKNLHITAIELDKCTYKALKYNIKEFKMTKNIKSYNTDSLTYLQNLNSDKSFDFIYIDPPWGGPEYKKEIDLKLSLSDIDIHDIIDDIFNKNITDTVFLKGPTNFKYKSENYNIDTVPFYTPNKKRISYYVYIIKKKI
jgi:16S rRNA G966 N2-methylase RsmD